MIVSYYSFKGGSGRSMTLANTAFWLYEKFGRKILLIDWDLEAPGLYAYLGLGEENGKKGVLDLFYDYQEKYDEAVSEGKSLSEENSIPVFDEQYIQSIRRNKKGGKIDIIGAGKGYISNKGEYRKRLGKFNWSNFYEKTDNKIYIDILRKKLKELEYDYVFIDTRTGYSLYNDMNIMYIPDVSVVVISPNKQSFDGAKEIIDSINNFSYKKTHTSVIPILSRLDKNVRANPQQVEDNFVKEFSSVFNIFEEEGRIHESFLMSFKKSYMGKYTIPYDATLANSENVIFNEENATINDGADITEAFINIAKLLEYPQHKLKVLVDCADECRKEDGLRSIASELLQVITEHKEFVDYVSPYIILAKTYRSMGLLGLDDERLENYFQATLNIAKNKLDKRLSNNNSSREYVTLCLLAFDIYFAEHNYPEAQLYLEKGLQKDHYNTLLDDKWKELSNAINTQTRLDAQLTGVTNSKEFIDIRDAFKMKEGDIILADLPNDVYFYPAQLLEVRQKQAPHYKVKFLAQEKEEFVFARDILPLIGTDGMGIAENDTILCIAKDEKIYYMKWLTVKKIDLTNGRVIAVQKGASEEVSLKFNQFCLTK